MTKCYLTCLVLSYCLLFGCSKSNDTDRNSFESKIIGFDKFIKINKFPYSKDVEQQKDLVSAYKALKPTASMWSLPVDFQNPDCKVIEFDSDYISGIKSFSFMYYFDVKRKGIIGESDRYFELEFDQYGKLIDDFSVGILELKNYNITGCASSSNLRGKAEHQNQK